MASRERPFRGTQGVPGRSCAPVPCRRCRASRAGALTSSDSCADHRRFNDRFNGPPRPPPWSRAPRRLWPLGHLRSHREPVPLAYVVPQPPDDEHLLLDLALALECPRFHLDVIHRPAPARRVPAWAGPVGGGRWREYANGEAPPIRPEASRFSPREDQGVPCIPDGPHYDTFALDVRIDLLRDGLLRLGLCVSHGHDTGLGRPDGLAPPASGLAQRARAGSTRGVAMTSMQVPGVVGGRRGVAGRCPGDAPACRTSQRRPCPPSPVLQARKRPAREIIYGAASRHGSDGASARVRLLAHACPRSAP